MTVIGARPPPRGSRLDAMRSAIAEALAVDPARGQRQGLDRQPRRRRGRGPDDLGPGRGDRRRRRPRMTDPAEPRDRTIRLLDTLRRRGCGRSTRSSPAGSGSTVAARPSRTGPLGNFRSFLFGDLLVRYLAARPDRHLGDEPDRRRRQDHRGRPPRATRPAREPTLRDPFQADAELGIDPARRDPARDRAYPADRRARPAADRPRQRVPGRGRSVYFAIDRGFPDTVELARLDTRARRVKTGARVAQDDYSKRRTPRTSRSGRGQSPRISRGTRRGAGAGPAGTSSAPP